jgi:hypothetical protein
MIDVILQGLFTGLGNAIGTFIALKYVVNHLEHEKLKEKIDILKQVKGKP